LKPAKEGYITDPSYLGITLIQDKSDWNNDLQLARGNYIDIKIKKYLSSISLLSQLNLITNSTKDESDIYGSRYLVETIDLEPSPSDTTLSPGYHFRTSPSLELKWKVINDDVEQEFTAKVPLTEYGTTTYEIRY